AAAVAKAEFAADAAGRAVGLVRQVIARSRTDLLVARAAPADPAPPADPFTQVAVKQATKNIPGGLDRARDAVGTASEAVVVAGATLDVFTQIIDDSPGFEVRP